MSICCCCWWQSAILCCLAQSETFWNTLGFDQVSCTETYYIVQIIPFVPPKYTAPSLQRREIEKSQARPMNGSLHPPNYPKNPAIKRHALQKAGKTETQKNGWYQVHGRFWKSEVARIPKLLLLHCALGSQCDLCSIFIVHGRMHRLRCDDLSRWVAKNAWKLNKLIRYNKM